MNLEEIKRPKKCNLCDGNVMYTSNSEIYGKEYGSGKCYICERCGAYVGTHEPRPEEALGLLANEEMRTMKMACHDAFDRLWLDSKDRRGERIKCYEWLAEKMGLPLELTHFGYMNLEQLKQAYKIIKERK